MSAMRQQFDAKTFSLQDGSKTNTDEMAAALKQLTQALWDVQLTRGEMGWQFDSDWLVVNNEMACKQVFLEQK